MPQSALAVARRRLHVYRAALSLEWSDSTVHPDFHARPDLPASAGQCGVSSAWLLLRALPWYLRIQARYCVGDVVVDGRTLEFHCWIEIGVPVWPGRWIVDVTCDQFELLADHDVVCDRHSSLVERSIEYRATSRQSARQLRSDPVWGRAQVLSQGMSRWFGSGH
ncbi:hypothetical protein ACXJJ3_04780 [Kribbella sp. WER1]